PLYTYNDVDRALGQCVSVPYGKEVEAARGVKFRFIEAGHILGSAIVAITAAGPDRDRTLTFSGDLARRGAPLFKAASPVPPAGGRRGRRLPGAPEQPRPGGGGRGEGGARAARRRRRHLRPGVRGQHAADVVPRAVRGDRVERDVRRRPHPVAPQAARGRPA